MYIPDGCVFLARKTVGSEIWERKPSWWLKVWIYLLMSANHTDNKYFKRGENMFSRKQIHIDCKLTLDGIDHKSVDNVIRWLKDKTMITTQKTTRGIIIKITNYDVYQNIVNYKKETKNDTGNDVTNDTETTQKRHTNDTINNNDNNNNNTIKQEHFDEVWKFYPRRLGKKDARRHFFASVKTMVDFDNIKRAMENYKNSKDYKNGFVMHGSTWFNNWQDYVDYKEPVQSNDTEKQDELNRKAREVFKI